MLAIYWTCSPEAKRRICEYLHINGYTTVNGETELEQCTHETRAWLEELQQRKFLQLRNKPNP